MVREAETTPSGRTLMHTACYHGHYEIARWLAERGHDLFAHDTLRTTPLHCAAHSGNPGKVMQRSPLRASYLTAEILNPL